MEIVQTPIEGLLEFRGRKFFDERGWFTEHFNPNNISPAYRNLLPVFVQDNLSFSKAGVIRGLHLQLAPSAQAKWVSVLAGRVYDVAVDLRPGSATFGKYYGLELTSEAQNGLFIPEGFAHGFAALEDTYFFYKCSAPYHPAAEAGICWNDPQLAIKWPIAQPTVSAKDQALPSLADFVRKYLISQPI
jgi:dTDP-4-dehydrorhamnose 3,5-epimerase